MCTRCVFLECLFIFCSCIQWLFKSASSTTVQVYSSLVNGRGDLTESLSLRLDVAQVFWSLRARTPGPRRVVGRAHAILLQRTGACEPAQKTLRGFRRQEELARCIVACRYRLLPAFTTTAKEDRIVASLSFTIKDWPAAVRSRLNSWHVHVCTDHAESYPDEPSL